MRRAALLAATSLAAILIQLTVLNRLPLPGGAAPDLVLVMVVAVALTGGPMDGMLTGFFAGLALDVAPPASHLVGQYALVFCVAGYASGRLSKGLSGASWLPLGAVALCAAGGEALYAAVGMLFGDPGVTWSAVRHVLPVSVGYDLLVCPFVLRLTVAARAWTTPGWAADGFLAGGGALAGRSALAGRAALAGPPGPPGAVAAGVAAAGAGRAVRDTGTGRSPRLRVGAPRHGDGWIGGASRLAGRAAAQVLATRPTHLRLRGGQAGSAAGAGPGKTLPARPVHLRFGHGGGSARGGPSSGLGAKARSAPPVHLRFGSGARRRDGRLGGSVLGRLGSGPKMPRGRVPRGSALRGGMPGGSALRGGMPGPGALGSKALGSKTLGSRALGSKARVSKARGGRMPRGSSLRGGGPGGSAVSRGGGSFGNGLRSGSGRGAEPRFRRKRRRGAATRGRARRGGLAGGGWLRRGRGRARFGRRSTMWRIGSKRTGGLS